MFADEFFNWDRRHHMFRELAQLQDEVHRLFAGEARGRGAHQPPINVWTNEEGAFLQAELPGYSADDIDISVLGDSVTISGERKPTPVAEGASFHRRERNVGRFSRTLQLPFRIESDKVHAKLAHGVLELMLPRAQADKPRKIPLTTH